MDDILHDADLYNKDELKLMGGSWLDEYFDKENTIFDRLTYRAILNILFDCRRSIYRVVEYKSVGHIINDNTYTLTHKNRTTILISLVEQLRNNVYLRIIFKYFLKHADNINFFHPHPKRNCLTTLPRILQGNHPDIVHWLLRRKEIQRMCIIELFTSCITTMEHIIIVLLVWKRLIEINGGTVEGLEFLEQKDLDKKWVEEMKYIHKNFEKIDGCVEVQKKYTQFFLRILSNYLTMDIVPSRRIVAAIAPNCKSGFRRIVYTLMSNISTVGNNFRFFPVFRWHKMPDFELDFLTDNIKIMFTTRHIILHSAHELLQIYCSLVKDYKIHVTIPPKIIEYFVTKRIYEPQHLLLFECMELLEPFKHLISCNDPTYAYIRTRYRVRYDKFIIFWRHRTYRPGSIFFEKLCDKYSSIMCMRVEEGLRPSKRPRFVSTIVSFDTLEKIIKCNKNKIESF